MFSPTPRRSFETPSNLLTPPAPLFPGNGADAQDLKTPRPFYWHGADQDEATEDLREILAPKSSWTKLMPEYAPAFDLRCSSAASTSATALSPVPMQFPISPASSSDLDIVSPTDPEDDIDAPSSEDQQHQCPPGALDKSSWLQARKVFVGGIPQTVDQKELYSMFSKHGKVKKAWLQLFHNDQGASKESPAKKHRGFGFIIFCEKQSVDKLLGTDLSLFVCFPNDIRLEVKRSVSKASSEEKETAGKAKRSTMETSPPRSTMHQNTVASSHTFPSASPVGLQMPSCPSPWQGPSVAIVPQAILIPVPMPFFPVVGATAVPWAPLGGITVCSYPSVAPAPQQIGQQAGQQNPLDQQPHSWSLPDVLLEGFVGEKPQNSEEMKSALLGAMPESYDD